MKTQKETKSEDLNQLTKSPRKINKIKVALLSTLFIISVIGGYKLIQLTYNYFHSHTYINLKVNFSVELPKMITNEEYQRQLDEKKQVEDLSNKAIELLKKDQEIKKAQETKKETSFQLVKPVLAESNYTYTNYSKKPYYNEVMEGLKKRFINWEDAAQLEAMEGGFDPKAINPTSGACGLPQALPCKKMGCSLTDIDCQLDWMKKYIGDRYGTVDEALKFRIANKWY